ncbi:uroporphyrinogen-III synthase [Coniochaeta sp. 2T2.1]|nr:uroporphyrinogen-III synthase [Coniochaeta sp. 2T2.1]
MSAPKPEDAAQTIPILLLKTKSNPGDAYEEVFSAKGSENGLNFDPRFLPVLEHRFKPDGLARIRELLQDRRIGSGKKSSYGGLIFTSQRAVEAFAEVVEEGKGNLGWPHLQDVPVYSVGPATTRALRAVSQSPPLNIFGEHTGNGDSLSQFMLEHYAEWYEGRSEKPPLLFSVGEQRRDIIPKTLMSAELPNERRVPVDELVVYGTGVMESFRDNLAQTLEDTRGSETRWVVVFSPTGCDVMLTGLGLLDENGTIAMTREKHQGDGRNTFVATIGPTTRDYLRRKFEFEPDACAAEPSPEGVLNAIVQFMKDHQSKHG